MDEIRRKTLKAAGALGAVAMLPSLARANHHGHHDHAAHGKLASGVDQMLRSATDAGEVPGVIAMATNRKDTIYEGAFGKRALGSDAAMTMDTVVWIASMTKALTGAAAMQQVERGKLHLDTPASQVLPELKEARVLTGWGPDDKPLTRPPKREITLRHLLTHTAGFSYEIWNADIGKYQKVMNVPGIISCTNAALTTPLIADPGTRWEYGTGIDFAGKMVEAVSGQKLGDYMTEHLFQPLGMDDTAFKIRPDMRERLAKVHQRGADGALTPIDFEIPQEPEFQMGGGGLYSTAGDYLKFVQMMLNGGKGNGERVFKPETVALMSKNAMGKLRVRKLAPAIPPLSNDAQFFPGVPMSWGLSFMINETKAPTGRSAGSLAWAGLANSYYWIDQKKGVGGVFLSQVLPFADVKALPLFYGFEKQVYQSLG